MNYDLCTAAGYFHKHGRAELSNTRKEGRPEVVMLVKPLGELDHRRHLNHMNAIKCELIDASDGSVKVACKDDPVIFIQQNLLHHVEADTFQDHTLLAFPRGTSKERQEHCGAYTDDKIACHRWKRLKVERETKTITYITTRKGYVAQTVEVFK